MSNFDSEWLVNKIQEIVDAPRNPHSVIASGVDESASRAYAREVRDHVTKRTSAAAEDRKTRLSAS